MNVTISSAAQQFVQPEEVQAMLRLVHFRTRWQVISGEVAWVVVESPGNVSIMLEREFSLDNCTN